MGTDRRSVPIAGDRKACGNIVPFGQTAVLGHTIYQAIRVQVRRLYR